METVLSDNSANFEKAALLPGLSTLDDAGRFQAWALEQNRLGTVHQVIESLTLQGSEIAIFRAACLGHWFVRPNTYRPLMQQSFRASDVTVRTYSQAVLALLDFVGSHQGVRYCIPLLEEALKQLETLRQSSLLLEAKATIQTNLGLIVSALGEYERGRSLAAQAVFTSRQLEMPICETRAGNLMVQVNLLSGRVVDGLSVIQQNLETGIRDQHAATYQHTSLAGCLAHLGNVDEAIRWLESPLQEAVNPLASSAVRQWFACLGGYDDLHSPIEERYAPVNNERWLVESLRGLLKARSQPRVNKNLCQYKSHLNTSLASTRAATQFASDWYLLLNRWIGSTALLWQGKAVPSAHTLTGLRTPTKEWLELRLLLAGLRLEQALDLNLPSLAIEPAEEELLEVFRDAEAIEMASPEGLADLLMFWHPLAAAYMAVAFPNLPHLSPALDSILRLGSKNSALGTTVSPALAGELLLRSLNLDLRESQPLTQVKLGAGERGNFREEILTFTRGPRTYYQPPISALQIAYGLRKHGAGSLMAEVAWSILNQYGLCPKASGSEMQLRMGTLEALTHDLLDDRITVQEFSRGCYALV
ncbi:hypothetical protein [uncultured Meiothermus sp.]|jgi:tetratricopeptide (TPR) repeat protein|uniref:hypothetical protein n=1 Tax=uncultured Meiothermus sp. TaxID=157471 RepID=UPI00263003CE|nr:hypothetical protein [uncultured Meiothermus sp.]